MELSRQFTITLKYGADKNEKVISGLKRISKPGLRVYANTEDIPKVLGGLGIAIISTNKGVVTDKEAQKTRRRRRGSLLRLVGIENLARYFELSTKAHPETWRGVFEPS